MPCRTRFSPVLEELGTGRSKSRDEHVFNILVALQMRRTFIRTSCAFAAFAFTSFFANRVSYNVNQLQNLQPPKPGKRLSLKKNLTSSKMSDKGTCHLCVFVHG